MRHGLCICPERHKCECTRVSLNVFTTGKCLIMGARDRTQVEWCWRFFREILAENHTAFYRPIVDVRAMRAALVPRARSFKDFLPRTRT